MVVIVLPAKYKQFVRLQPLLQQLPQLKMEAAVAVAVAVEEAFV